MKKCLKLYIDYIVFQFFSNLLFYKFQFEMKYHKCIHFNEYGFNSILNTSPNSFLFWQKGACKFEVHLEVFNTHWYNQKCI